jgi:WD40 repeat protein
MFTGAKDGTVRLWETSTGQELGHTAWSDWSVDSVAFSPNGQQMLAASASGGHLWDRDMRTGVSFEKGHLRAVTSIAFSPDGQQVLTGSYDQSMLLWEASSGRIKKWFVELQLDPKKRTGWLGVLEGTLNYVTRMATPLPEVLSVAFSSDGKLVASGQSDGKVRLWEVSSGHKLGQLSGHEGIITSVAFSPDGRFVLTGAADKTARLWETRSRRELHKLEHMGKVSCTTFSPRGLLAVTCDDAGYVYFWRVREPETGSLQGLYVAPLEIVAVCWKDARHILLADRGGGRVKPYVYHLVLEGDWEG